MNGVVISGAERDRLFRKQVSLFPAFAKYQKKTTRTVPVVALDRAG